MKIWKLSDDIDTDTLAPGVMMKHDVDVIARHCLEAVRPAFAKEVRRGDVIVATGTFGIGSSREQSAGVLVHLGVAAVIAPAYSGLYFRNAFNVGLLLLTCPRAAEIAEGGTLSFDARQARISTSTGLQLPCLPIPPFLLDMVEAGGLLQQLKRQRQESPT